METSIDVNSLKNKTIEGGEVVLLRAQMVMWSCDTNVSTSYKKAGWSFLVRTSFLPEIMATKY